jgi:hypothetical protein
MLIKQHPLRFNNQGEDALHVREGMIAKNDFAVFDHSHLSTGAVEG